MATKTLAEKLYVRPGYTVALLGAPKGASELLKPLPDDAKIITNTKEPVNLILLFAKNASELEKGVTEVAPVLKDEIILWFAFPKQSSKVATDLSRDHGWEPIQSLSYEAVATVAIDGTWSGIRFKKVKPNDESDPLAKQYSGERAAFRPIYNQLVTMIRNFGPDVEMVVRQGYVAFARSRQFALILPANDRINLVMRLPNAPLGSRLMRATGMGSGSMTHKLYITKLEDIDRQVVLWLQDAYRGAIR